MTWSQASVGWNFKFGLTADLNPAQDGRDVIFFLFRPHHSGGWRTQLWHACTQSVCHIIAAAPEDNHMFHLNQMLPNQPISESGAGPPFIVMMFCLVPKNIVLTF